MKHILCYGDSNTFGYDAKAASPAECRFAWEVRWPGILQAELGDGYRVLEEGLGGRTCAFDDPTSPGRSGLAWLEPCVQSHQPLDLVIVMLGTNDTKTLFHAPACEIARGMGCLLRLLRNPSVYDRGVAPEVLAVAPAPMTEKALSSPVSGPFDAQSIERSGQLAELYREQAAFCGCHFFDGQQVVRPEADGVHLDAAGHETLGKALAKKCLEILG